MAKRPSDNSEKEPPSRNLGLAGHTDIRQIVAAGARKERIMQRAWKPAAFYRRRPYAELHAASAFSFLEGASLPEDLIAQAAELELPAVALVDRNGPNGAPRSYKAARAAGVRALVGAEVSLSWERQESWTRGRGDAVTRGAGAERGRKRESPPRPLSPSSSPSHAFGREPYRLQEPLPLDHGRCAREAERGDERHVGTD